MSVDLMSIKALAVLIPIIGGALAYLVPRLWRGLRKFVFLMNDIVGSPEKPSLYSLVVQLQEQLQRIDKELHPNGGSSMRDQIIRLEHEVGQVKGMATDAKERAADAASEAQGLSGAVARLTTEASRERRGLQESVEVLTGALQEFASEMHVKEVTYLADAREQGVNLRPLLSPPPEEDP